MTTHGPQEAVDACVSFTDILADAIVGRARSQILQPRNGSNGGRIGDIVGGSWRGKCRDEIKTSGYVAHSLEAALWCVGRTGNFRDAVILAANLRHDADTTAAITGQLAGFIYGWSGIDGDWLGKLCLAPTICMSAAELFERAMTNVERKHASS